MKTKFILIFIIGIGLVLNTCRKDEDGEMGEYEMTLEESILHEALSDEQVAYYDKQETKEFDIDEILMSNGLTVKEFLQNNKKGNNKGILAGKDPIKLKDEIISKILANASYFCDRDNFTLSSDGDKMPAQRGLAYSYGQRDYAHRLPVPAGFCKEWKVYGLDCSGFVYNCFLRDMGINLMEDKWTNAERQRKSDFLKSAIKAKYPGFDKLRVDDLGKIDTSKLISGDIIYWMKLNEKTSTMKAVHIGIIIKHETTGFLWVAQSNGSDGESGDCVKNWTTKRGPNIFRLKKCMGPEPNFGEDFGIVRIGVEPSIPPNYNQISLMVKVYAQYDGFLGIQTNSSINVYKAYSGGFKENNRFEANGALTEGTNKVTGTIQAQFNYAYDTILCLEWSEFVSHSATSTTKAYTEKKSCKLVNVPKAYGGIFEVKGETTGSDVCSHIKELNYMRQGESNSSLKNWLCVSTSHVFVSLSKK